MGQKIVLSDTTFTGVGLTPLRNDSLLSAGSLFLFDPGHTLGGFTGVPLTGATVPNVAWAEAAALLGSGTESSLAGAVTFAGDTAGQFMVERTNKKGLHGIISQTNQVATSLSWTVNLPEAIRAYVFANYARGIYASIWSATTRKATSDNPAAQSHFHHENGTTNYGFASPNGSPVPFGGLGRTVIPTPTDTAIVAPANRFISVAVNSVTNAGPGALKPIQLGVGSFATWGYAGTVNKQASKIIYRVYLEDLTASGRTYAQVNALDYALFVAAFSAGGKFYGDTYTAPSTLP